jgi:hypothetical protein
MGRSDFKPYRQRMIRLTIVRDPPADPMGPALNSWRQHCRLGTGCDPAAAYFFMLPGPVTALTKVSIAKADRIV